MFDVILSLLGGSAQDVAINRDLPLLAPRVNRRKRENSVNVIIDSSQERGRREPSLMLFIPYSLEIRKVGDRAADTWFAGIRLRARELRLGIGWWWAWLRRYLYLDDSWRWALGLLVFSSLMKYSFDERTTKLAWKTCQLNRKEKLSTLELDRPFSADELGITHP